MEWDNDKELRLIALRREGHTFLECAVALGVSRSAIGGKCRRMGLSKVVEKPIHVDRSVRTKPWRPVTLINPRVNGHKRDLYEELRKAVENTK